MPTYTFKCPECGRIYESTRPIEFRDDEVYCFNKLAHEGLCIREMERQPGAPAVNIPGGTPRFYQ